jgi:hypothetical protein
MNFKQEILSIIFVVTSAWIANTGIFQDDLTFDDFLAEVNTYRNAIN